MEFSKIYEAWLERKAAREAAGFNMPGDRAIEDVAYEWDISIRQVCEAISVGRGD